MRILTGGHPIRRNLLRADSAGGALALDAPPSNGASAVLTLIRCGGYLPRFGGRRGGSLHGGWGSGCSVRRISWS